MSLLLAGVAAKAASNVGKEIVKKVAEHQIAKGAAKVAQQILFPLGNSNLAYPTIGGWLPMPSPETMLRITVASGLIIGGIYLVSKL